MSPRRLWLSVAAVLAIASSSSCNCGVARVVTALDGGHAYERYAPSSGFAAGAAVSKSQNFKMIGEVNAPAGAASRSQNFQLKGGVVEASQE